MTVEKKPSITVHARVIEEPKVEYDAPLFPLSSDPVQMSRCVAPDPSIDDSEDDVKADS